MRRVHWCVYVWVTLCVRLLVCGVYASRCLAELMMRCWSKDPHQRPSMADVITELRSILTLPTVSRLRTGSAVGEEDEEEAGEGKEEDGEVTASEARAGVAPREGDVETAVKAITVPVAGDEGDTSHEDVEDEGEVVEVVDVGASPQRSGGTHGPLRSSGATRSGGGAGRAVGGGAGVGAAAGAGADVPRRLG
jgi:hypothetical protein